MGRPAAGTPEARARETIDRLLDRAGWDVQDMQDVNLSARRGVALREFPLVRGHGEADYLLYVDGKAAGVVEAKPEGATLTGVETQSAKYSVGLPADLPAHIRPLPFCYESTGAVTRFTCRLDPDPRSREVFSFHRPETIAALIAALPVRTTTPSDKSLDGLSLRTRLRMMPPLDTKGLWPAQKKAIENLEASLAQDRPRALIQMATGSGKTFTMVSQIYRLIKFGGARRVLFLVDRANLGRQTVREFQQYVTPDDGRKFTELYNVQHLRSNKLDRVSRVCVSTIQRLYSMLKGEAELDPALEEASTFEVGPMQEEALPIEYNPEIPIETFDVVITDECHRSIYRLWRQVLEYFDAFLVGLTATPSKQTFGFFHKNLVMEYGHEQAVADGVNVDFDVYNIRTRIGEAGSKVDAGLFIDKRDRESRKVRWEKLDEDLVYDPGQLDREVVAKDLIRTVVRTFRDRLFTEIFPGRTEVPKTVVFAKNDSHAEDIVEIVREEFGRGNDFCKKVTYMTTGADPEDLIAEFRNSFNPRIIVTVDMVATGTDIRPLEIVFFLRSVKSRIFFEQMKGRGVRVVDTNELRAVTPDAAAKERFVIVDAVGVCESDLADTKPLEKEPTVPLEKLLQRIALGNREPKALSSLASRLARIDRRLSEADRRELEGLAGRPIRSIAAALVEALNPDLPPKEAKARMEEAVKSIAQVPQFRQRLVEVGRTQEQVIDTVSIDEVTEAGFSAAAREKAKGVVESFEGFLREHKDEITALQVLYSRPYRERLTYRQIKDLATAIGRPPLSLKSEVVWKAYEALDRSRVRGSGGRVLTDVVSLVRFALKQDAALVPFPEVVRERFAAWMTQQESGRRRFTDEQRQWLELIRDHIAASFRIEMDDFELTPFHQRGGLGKVTQVFGADLPTLLEELNSTLVA